MIGRLGTRQAATRIRMAGWLIAVPASLLALVLGLAVPALAATGARTAGATQGPGAARPVAAHALAAPAVAAPAVAADAVAARAVTLRTLVRSVNVRSEPRLSARITGHLGRKGAKVVINCFATGSPVLGNPVWYHLEQPRSGYVTSYYLDSHYDPVAGLGRCGAAGFRRTYRTLVAGLHIRSLATAFATRVTTVRRMGSAVTVTCWIYGQAINGNPVWYRTVAPRSGYVAGQHLNTGRDPAKGVPPCR